jgi:hypothetical protein
VSSTAANDNKITLYLEGSRAVRGVKLSDFESFVEHFLGALRDFDRSRRGVPTKTEGHPDKRAEVVTAFRMVGFREGSGIATLEPDVADDLSNALFEGPPPQVENLDALLDSMSEETLPPVVSEALLKACRSLGNEGRISVESAAEPDRRTTIDAAVLERSRAATTTAAESSFRTVSGRMHLLDLEPGKLAIRASDGVDWVCEYPEKLESAVLQLVGRIVWAQGEGLQLSAKRGLMQIQAVQTVAEGEQEAFFTLEPVPANLLMTQQGIAAAQGLAAVGDSDWDPEADADYLAALLSA